MNTLKSLTIVAAVLLGINLAHAQEKSEQPPAKEPELSDLEKQFAEKLTNVVLVGHFTAGKEADKPKEERYTITSAKKLFGERWLINARIQFGDKDVSVPLIVPVKWAGDTPMISITDLSIPGLGTYTARVIFYGDKYAGTWSGKDHGGHLWGRLEPAKEEAK